MRSSREASLRCTTSTMGLLVASFGRSFWSFLGELSCRQIRSSWIDVCFANDCPSVSVTLETSQPYVITSVTVAPVVVQLVDTELLGIHGLVGPEEFHVAGSTVVILGLLKMQDVIDL